jgi:multiple sugar transport system permease protein
VRSEAFSTPVLFVCRIQEATIVAPAVANAIFAATGGGPGDATEILNLYAYRTSFTQLNIGYGAALAMVLLVLTVSISWLMFRLRRPR